MNAIAGITSAARPVTAIASTGTPALTEDQKKLRKAAADLEGLFVSQLFRAMRETVPKNDGFTSGGSGEEIFTGLMDEHLAAETPSHWGSGISEALYRQLSRGLPAASATGLPTSSSTTQDVQTSILPGR